MLNERNRAGWIDLAECIVIHAHALVIQVDHLGIELGACLLACHHESTSLRLQHTAPDLHLIVVFFDDALFGLVRSSTAHF